jgi:hypothetical protein
VPAVLPAGGRPYPLTGPRAAWPPRARGQDASRWLLPRRQRGLCVAVLARGRGGRIKVAVA